MGLDKLLKQYDYKLPSELIAQKPVNPRDNARLLVYRKSNGKIFYDQFKNIEKYLPKNAVLVFNQTKVIPARIEIIKPTGGKAELLYLGYDNKNIKALCNKKLPLNATITLNHGRDLKLCKIIQVKKGEYTLKPNFPTNQILSMLNKYGKTPLPPYIKNSPLTEKQKRMEYQTIFAKTGTSVAAPTASLHFTKKLLKNLKKQGIKTEFISLNVGLGTFAPLTEQNLKTNKLHKEYYVIDKKTANRLNQYKSDGKKIIAVGTTALRTLESYANTKKLTGKTDLFIKPGYKFQITNGLITNFHVPKSSLLMLVSALMGTGNLKNIYTQAINKKFRFFSFGDGMLILP